MPRGATAGLSADLHTHSTASDGEYAPAALVEMAARQGLSVLALTDHDTTAGLEEAIGAGGAAGIMVIGGIELSTDVPSGELHILGYGIDPSYPPLVASLARFRAASVDRLETMLTRLADLGIALDPATIVPRRGDHAVGRPHIARALVAAGYAASVADAFERYLGEGRPAYVRKERPPPAAAVELIRQAGGLPVLAHPLGVRELDAWLPALIERGLAGLECFYGAYALDRRLELAALADRLRLLATGGSDFHGESIDAQRKLGSVEIPVERVERFLDAYMHRRAG